MVFLQSYDRRKAHSFSGESEAAPVLRMLNGAPEPGHERRFRAAQRRVIAVLNAIRDLFRNMQEKPNWHKGVETGEDGPIELVGAEMSKSFAAVNQLLLKYTSCSIFHPAFEVPRKWKVGEAIIDRHSLWESRAVHALVRLADQGLLDRLKTCDCGVWYFARFSHQQFCSAECRIRFWEGSEERKEKKRERARENYLYNKAHRKPSPKRGRFKQRKSKGISGLGRRHGTQKAR